MDGSKKYSHEMALLSFFLRNSVIILVFIVFASAVRFLAVFFYNGNDR